LNDLGWKLFNALFPRALESFSRRLASKSSGTNNGNKTVARIQPLATNPSQKVEPPQLYPKAQTAKPLIHDKPNERANRRETGKRSAAG